MPEEMLGSDFDDWLESEGIADSVEIAARVKVAAWQAMQIQTVNAENYDQAICLLNTMLDEIHDNEKHRLIDVLDVFSDKIKVYEDTLPPFLDIVPNETTTAAIKDARSGKSDSFNNLDELMNDLKNNR